MSWLRRLGAWLATPPSATRAVPPEEAAPDDPPPVSLPLSGELDLHTFAPKEVSELVEDYVLACQEAGVLALRIVHGKGKGTLRRTVHARLSRLPAVRRFGLAPPERGGWGATLVDLHPLHPPESVEPSSR